MTKEEAARILAVWKEKFRFTDGGEQVIDLAIEALKAEPCEDTISRQAAIEAVHEEFDECIVWDESGEHTADEVERILACVPPAQPEQFRAKKPTDCPLQELKTEKMQKCSQCQYRLQARLRR